MRFDPRRSGLDDRSEGGLQKIRHKGSTWSRHGRRNRSALKWLADEYERVNAKKKRAMQWFDSVVDAVRGR